MDTSGKPFLNQEEFDHLIAWMKGRVSRVFEISAGLYIQANLDVPKSVELRRNVLKGYLRGIAVGMAYEDFVPKNDPDGLVRQIHVLQTKVGAAYEMLRMAFQARCATSRLKDNPELKAQSKKILSIVEGLPADPGLSDAVKAVVGRAILVKFETGEDIN